MVRVRANESVRLAIAKRIKTHNIGGETSNPPTQREIGKGETLNPPSQREIRGGETPNPPTQREIRGRETPNPQTQREIRERETSNPHSQREIGGGETPHPPPQRKIGGGEIPNPPSQREIGRGETPHPPPQRKIGGGEIPNPPSQREIGGDETLNPPPPPQEEIGGGREIVTIDTDLLDCSICVHPLCPPLYQCMNGHVACPSCWSKVQLKCHICNVPVVTRNIALEKVLRSVHLPCTYAHLGCRKSVSYSQRQVHADACEFGPSICPIPGCAHKVSSGEWRGHFLKDHRNPCIHYGYGHSRTIRFNEEDPYYTLFGPGKDLFLLVKEPIPNFGNALSLCYIDLPDRGQNVFPYELEVVARENYITSLVQLKSQAVSIKEWKRGEVHGRDRSLLVPLGFRERNMKIHVLINKELGEELDEESDTISSD